ncbi:hypothetical protein HOH87_05560 [bacterium]|jgi:hypothetical protein|nr:hypothetical protein [bacterium]
MNESGHVVSQTKCWPSSWNPFGFGSTNAAKVSDVSAGNTQAGTEKAPLTVVIEGHAPTTDAHLRAQVGVKPVSIEDAPVVTEKRDSDASNASGSGVTGRPSNEDSGDEDSDVVGDLREKPNPVDKKAYKQSSTNQIFVNPKVRGIQEMDREYMREYCEGGLLNGIERIRGEMGDENFRSLIQMCVYENEEMGVYSKKTTLHIAASNFKICQLLINFGADMNKEDKFGRTPFHSALPLTIKRVTDETRKVAMLFIKSGANLDAADTQGVTPKNKLYDLGLDGLLQ